jgi:hypothetical protein
VELCRRVEAEEEGCLQYEVFRSALHPEKYMLAELWANQQIYDKHWRLQQEREKSEPPKPPAPTPPGLPSRQATVEFYRHDPYRNIEGVWFPADPSARSETVRWS